MEAMHRLIVMRHAKAGELPGGPDYDRALTSRGERNAAAAGAWLAASGFRPDAVLCSAAVRTRQTWDGVAGVLGGDADVTAEQRLYEADSAELAEVIRQTSTGVGTLLYVGHNPAAAELVGLIAGTEPEFPTAAIAVIDVPGEWATLSAGSGELIASWVPRSRQ